jgi:hypothetical protein
MSILTVKKLIEDNPCFHEENGQLANWGVLPEALEFIVEHVNFNMKTLEIGAGQTTVAFAIVSGKHICISPNQKEHQRIGEYCDQFGLTEKIHFICDSSDVVLPMQRNDISTDLDFVFIDGAHRFPYPIVDWHYLQKRLAIGGIIGLDDIEIPSIKVLHDFLNGEEEWELLNIIGNRIAFFRYLRKPIVIKDHWDQIFNKALLLEIEKRKKQERPNLFYQVWRKAKRILK